MEEVILRLAISAGFSFWGYKVAEQKGFNTALSAVAAFFFTWIAMIVLYVRKGKV